MAQERDKEKCPRCSKKFIKSEYIHSEVYRAGIRLLSSNRWPFQLVDDQQKSTGTAYWACRPCMVYAKVMNHQLRQTEEKISNVEMEMENRMLRLKSKRGTVQRGTQEEGWKEGEGSEGWSGQSLLGIAKMRIKKIERGFPLNGGTGMWQSYRNKRTELGQEELWENFWDSGVGPEEIKFCRRAGKKRVEPHLLMAGV